MNIWLKIAIGGVLVAVIGVLIWQYVQCKKKSTQIGIPCKCRMFSSVPIMLTAVDEYYDIRYGKCYRFTDYGESMSVREVELSNCNLK